MAHPNYENLKSSIEEMISMMSRLNPFVMFKDSEIKSDPVLENLYKIYSSMEKNLKDITSDKKSLNEKNTAWEAFIAAIEKNKGEFDLSEEENSVEDKTKVLEESKANLAEWQFGQVLKNLDAQVQIMQQRELIKPVNEEQVKKFLEDYDSYAEAGKAIDETYAEFTSYEDWQKKQSEAADALKKAAEEQARTEKEKNTAAENLQKHKDKPYPNTHLTRKTLMKFDTEAEGRDHTIPEIYNYYSKQAGKKKEALDAIDFDLSATMNTMNLDLQNQDEKRQEEIKNLTAELESYVPKTAEMTKDVIKTLDMANVESKIFGDNYQIDSFFQKLDDDYNRASQTAVFKVSDNTVGRAFVSVAGFFSEGVKNSLNASDELKVRKTYLQRLKDYDMYQDGFADLKTESIKMQGKYTLSGKNFDEIVADGRKLKSSGTSDKALPGSNEAVCIAAFDAFESLKTKFITLMCTGEDGYKHTKGFEAEVRKIETMGEFLSSGAAYIGYYYNDMLGKGYYRSKDNKKPLTKEEEATNAACMEITKNYLQKKENIKRIKEIQAQIKALNEKKINPVLTGTFRAKESIIKDFKEAGVDTKDLEQLYKDRETAVIEKKLADENFAEIAKSYKLYQSEEKLKQDWDKKYKVLEDKYNKAFNAHETAKKNFVLATAESKKRDSQGAAMAKLFSTYTMLKNQEQEITKNVYAANDPSASALKDSVKSIAASLRHFKNTAAVGRNSVFADSKVYTDMIDAVKELLGSAEDGEKKGIAFDKKTPSEIKAGLDKIAAAAKAYITAKNKQIRLFPSTQRLTRLAYANNLMEFAKSSSGYIADISTRVMGIKKLANKDAFDRVAADLGNNIADMNDFVGNIIQKAKVIADQKAEQARVEASKPKLNLDLSKISPLVLLKEEGIDVTKNKPQVQQNNKKQQVPQNGKNPEEPNLGQLVKKDH